MNSFQDPLLLALQKEDDDSMARRTIKVDNQSELEIMACPYYGDGCFFNIAPGETKSGTVTYQIFPGDPEDGDIGISLRRKDNRKTFKSD